MKKLLVMLMVVGGLNAYVYADALQFTNNTGNYMAAQCMPSGFNCNGMQSGNCTCPSTDTSIYFGHTGMPQSQAYLDSHTMYSDTWVNFRDTSDQDISYGSVFKITKNVDQDPGYTMIQVVTVFGDPSDTMSCTYSLTK